MSINFTARTILILLALFFFLLAIIGVRDRGEWVPLGLFFLTASFLVG